MKTRSILVLTALALCEVASATADCPPAGYSRESLLELRESGFESAAAQRQGLALSLLDCLADPDPQIRDGVAYEALANWLRGEMLDAETIDSISGRLLDELAGEGDSRGFLQPFAALVLSEVARTDRVGDTFSPERREDLVRAAVTYMAAIRDYRGFSDTEGWRHAVAHGADLVLQLVLNQHIDAGQVDRLVSAALGQVSPAGGHAYIHGESGRLARAVYYAHGRGIVEDGRWQEWFRMIGDPAPFGTWADTYGSEAGLARRHNTLGFLMALHVYAGASEKERDSALGKLIMETLERVW